MAGLILLLFWTVRLVKRGRALTQDTGEPARKTPDTDGTQDIIVDKDQATDAKLLELAKASLVASLAFDSDKMEQAESALVDFLNSEQEQIMSQGRKNITAKQVIMKKIRCALVQHPYDNIGRQMAAHARTLYKRKVLNETKWWHRVQESFDIQKILRSNQRVRKVLLLTPILLASIGMLHKSVVYCTDMTSDIQVILELKENIAMFHIPKISTLLNKTQLN